MVIRTFQRCEKKYLLTYNQFEQFLSKLMQYVSFDPYCPNGNTYGIYSIYFDTPDSLLIRRSISKPPYKEKLRLRSYSPMLNDEDKCFLEIKKKIQGVVSKRRVTLTYKDAMGFLNDGIPPLGGDFLSQQVLNELSYALGLYRPLPEVYISYDRLALFANEDSGLRITFDKNILTRRYDLDFHSGNYGEPLIPEGSRLMEIKCGGTLPLWLVEILSECEIYPRSFSKYGKEYRAFLAGKNTKEKQIIRV